MNTIDDSMPSARDGNMTVKQLQTALGVKTDGKFGPLSRAALLTAFSNTKAPAVTDADVAALAARLGCDERQLRAVAAVESGGSGFDKSGRPKILFERHLFHRLTDGRWSPSSVSRPEPGGYDESSWDKLCDACERDPDAAFAACSWGKFQVLGLHWSKLGYASSFDLARSTVASEAAHYELLARYIEAFGLVDALNDIDGVPANARAFAKAYNGPAYQRYSYDVKIAAAYRAAGEQ